MTQLAHEFGAHVIGTGRAAGRQAVLDFGAQECVDLENNALDDVAGVSPEPFVVALLARIRALSGGAVPLRSPKTAQR